MSKLIGRLHVITDAHVDQRVFDVAEEVLAAGAPTLQLRIKAATDCEYLEAAQRLVALCRAYDAQLIVNDRVDIAVAAGADGAHVGDLDLPPEAARRVLGPDRLLGVTCRSPAAARRAEAAGADYLGAGPAYATSTKSGLPAPLGPDGIRAVAAAVSTPVIAVGGITPDRVRELLSAGAHGVAVVGAVFGADDPGRATKDLVSALLEECT